MLSLTSILVLILIATTLWGWNVNARSREAAIKAVNTACAQHALQLLDGSTHFHRCTLKRNHRGLLKVLRLYHFDYFDGQVRHQGEVSIFEFNPTSINFTHMNKHTKKNNNNPNPSNVIPFPNKRDIHSDE